MKKRIQYENTVLGVVVEILGPVNYVSLIDSLGHIDVSCRYACSLAGRRFEVGKPVVGDNVSVLLNADGHVDEGYQGVIVGISERSSLVERLDSMGRRRKSLVANLDLLVVVSSVQEPPMKPGLIDRYLVCARHWALESLICFSKWDLSETIDSLYVDLYKALGYQCIKVSSKTGEGLDDLRSYLSVHRSAFLGHSGVGKSTILNCLFPGADLAVGSLSVQSGRGRHTTTHSRLLAFEDGGFVIDTPGVREFGITGIKSAELWEKFVEFEEHAARCKFQPCTHTHEPDCGVRLAVDNECIAEFRYASYLKMYDELKDAEDNLY